MGAWCDEMGENWRDVFEAYKRVSERFLMSCGNCWQWTRDWRRWWLKWREIEEIEWVEFSSVCGEFARARLELKSSEGG
jgi:hypothetical protein